MVSTPWRALPSGDRLMSPSAAELPHTPVHCQVARSAGSTTGWARAPRGSRLVAASSQARGVEQRVMVGRGTVEGAAQSRLTRV